MNWNLETAFAFLEKNPFYNEFINEGRVCITYQLGKVEFLIYQENARAKFYFAVPKIEGADYESVYAFINVCSSELNRRIEKAQDKRAGIR